jgi:hypothetical protein
LAVNDIGRVVITTDRPIAADHYAASIASPVTLSAWALSKRWIRPPRGRGQPLRSHPCRRDPCPICCQGHQLAGNRKPRHIHHRGPGHQKLDLGGRCGARRGPNQDDPLLHSQAPLGADPMGEALRVLAFRRAV